MDIINISSLDENKITNIFQLTKSYYHSTDRKRFINLMFPNLDMSSTVLITAFFESSTRTQLSFESAMYLLGGNVIRFNKESSSINKGESLLDTLKTLEYYGDIIVLRHPEKNIFDNIKDIISTSIINAGNGDGEHPTQALLDLFCIWIKFDGFIEDKTIILYGDCTKSRTIHSLSKLLDIFNIKYYYLSYPDRCNNSDPRYIKLEQLKDINPDVLYITRMQNERENGCVIPENMKVNLEFISKHICETKIKNKLFLLLHPLPRNDELSAELDSFNYAGYFKAIDYSVYLRAILICLCIY